MNKNSTHPSRSFITSDRQGSHIVREREHAVDCIDITESPRTLTLAKIRQFARSYSYIPAMGVLGGMELN